MTGNNLKTTARKGKKVMVRLKDFFKVFPADLPVELLVSEGKGSGYDTSDFWTYKKSIGEYLEYTGREDDGYVTKSGRTVHDHDILEGRVVSHRIYYEVNEGREGISVSVEIKAPAKAGAK